MNCRERLRTVLSHNSADRIAVDFGATSVTGIHCKVVQQLRDYYGLDPHPVIVHEPYQMLGLIEDDLADALSIDCVGAISRCNMFGTANENWREYKMPWGQVVMFPEDFAIVEKDGRLFVYPEGDTSVQASGMMPRTGYFFDAIERGPEQIDDSKLDVKDNLEEFSELSAADLEYWKGEVKKASATGRGVVLSLGGSALGDIALIPGMQLKNPKGIRRVAEWYMSTVIRTDYLKEIFETQTDIAIKNMAKINAEVGGMIDVVFLCGTDFGTQTSQFCSDQSFRDLYLPYYRKMTDWIHANTPWKTFKHSCGAIRPLVESFIDAGIDIVNPVQISASGMEPAALKHDFGDRITFWGGGVDTQGVFMYGTPADVAEQTRKQCDIFGENGGFVFNSVHNIQANVPFENVVSMFETLKKIRDV